MRPSSLTGKHTIRISSETAKVCLLYRELVEEHVHFLYESGRNGGKAGFGYAVGQGIDDSEMHSCDLQRALTVSCGCRTTIGQVFRQ